MQGCAAKMFEALYDVQGTGVNRVLPNFLLPRIRVSVSRRREVYVNDAAQAVHDAFALSR